MAQFLALCFLGCLLFSFAALAQSSATSISFQGVLNGANGQPLTNGSYHLTFRFYTNATTPFALGVTNVNSVPVAGGVASTAIPVEPAWFDGQTRYLGISVNGGAELAPRVMVTAVPYAVNAQNLGARQVFVTQAEEFTLDQLHAAKLRVPLLELGNLQHAQPTELRIVGPNTPAGENYRSELNFQFLNAGSARIAAFRGGTRDTSLEFLTQRPDRSFDEIRMTIDPYGRVGINTPSPLVDLDVNGTTRTRVLQITGGSDLAEPFDVTAPSGDFAVQPGMVMVIDREQDGKLTPCARAYDTAVAGVLSGANGLQPGMVMQAEGQPHAAGEHPLAMTGRVWCLADASHGPIQRGDRLTTSPTVGHAMKAADETRAPAP